MDKKQLNAPATGRNSPMTGRVSPMTGRASPMSFRHPLASSSNEFRRRRRDSGSDDEFTRKLREFTRRNRRAKQSLEQKQKDRWLSGLSSRRRSRSLSRYIYRPYDFSPNRTRRVTPYYSRYIGGHRSKRSDLLSLSFSSPYSSAAALSPSRGRTAVPDRFRYSSRSPTPSRLFRSSGGGSRPSTPTGQSSLRPHTPTSYGRAGRVSSGDYKPRYRHRSVSASRLPMGRSASYTRSRSVTPSGYRQGRSAERSPMIVPSGYRTRSPSPAAWTDSQSRGRSDMRPQTEYRRRSVSRDYSTSPSRSGYSSQTPSLQGLRDPRKSSDFLTQRKSARQQPRYEEFEGDSVSSSSTITAASSYKSKRGGQIQEQPRFQYKSESARGVDSSFVTETSQHVEASGAKVESTSFGELSVSTEQKAQYQSDNNQIIKQQLKASNSVHLAGVTTKSSKKVVSKKSSSTTASSEKVSKKKTSEKQASKKDIPVAAKKLLKNFYRTVSSEKLLKDAKAGKLADVDPEELKSKVLSLTADDDTESITSVESSASKQQRKAVKIDHTKRATKKSSSKTVKSSVRKEKVAGESKISTGSERPDTLALKNKARLVDDATRQAHDESPLVDSRERTRANTSSAQSQSDATSKLQRRYSRSNTKSRSPTEEEYFTARSGSEVGDNTSEIDSEEDMSSLHERKKLLASTFGESKFTSKSSTSSTKVSQQSSVKTSKTSSKFSVEESATSVKSTKSIEIKSSKTSSSSKFESSTQSVKLQKSGGAFSIKQDESSSESSKTGKLKIKKSKPKSKMPPPQLTGAEAIQQAKEALLKRKQKKKAAKKEKAEQTIEHAKLKHVHQKRGSDASSVDLNVNLKPIPSKQKVETTEITSEAAEQTASAVKVEHAHTETKISATESAKVSAVPKIS